MARRIGPLTIPWLRDTAADDPYWQRFLDTPFSDPANSAIEMVRTAPEGNVFPARADIHTPEITATHIKELARFLGADLVGIARLDAADPADQTAYPFAVVSVVRAEVDPRTAPGLGGQIPVQNGLYVTFVLSAYIRELGYRATAHGGPPGDPLAVAAGLGTLGADGRLVTPQFGSKVYVVDVIRTDLPLAADG
jgi:hypothetical protein